MRKLSGLSPCAATGDGVGCESQTALLGLVDLLSLCVPALEGMTVWLPEGGEGHLRLGRDVSLGEGMCDDSGQASHAVEAWYRVGEGEADGRSGPSAD